MIARDLWAVLSVEEGTFHRFEVLYDDWRSAGQLLDPDGFPLPPEGPKWGYGYLPVGARAAFDRLVEPGVDDGLSDVAVSLVPRRDQSEHAVGLAGVMWVKLDTGAQLKRLQAFRPGPSLVLREGESVRRTAVWFVDPHPNVVQLERGNRRLAHAVGAKKKYADATTLVHPPGVVLRYGRDRRPVVVHVEHYSGEFFTPGQVAGRLRDAPDPWRPEAIAA